MAERPNNLTLVLTIDSVNITLAVGKPDADPELRLLDAGDLDEALALVPGIVQEVEQRWDEAMRFPSYQPPKQREKQQKEQDRAQAEEKKANEPQTIPMELI